MVLHDLADFSCLCLFADALEFIVTVMVGAEDSVNEPAEGGATALHYAVSGGHEECVRVLVQYGADINSITTTEEVKGERGGGGERERERGVFLLLPLFNL